MRCESIVSLVLSLKMIVIMSLEYVYELVIWFLEDISFNRALKDSE